MRIIRREELSKAREPARFLEVQVRDEQSILRRPQERTVSRRVKRFACERKGNHPISIGRQGSSVNT
jgi:hypothetical protein